MNKHSRIALVALFASSLFAPLAAQAAEPAATPISLAQAAPPTAAKQAQAVPSAAVAAPQKIAASSQQDKMRECNKQATGKQGGERKTFMKTCLSKKA